jgi:hypothetical protein
LILLDLVLMACDLYDSVHGRILLNVSNLPGREGPANIAIDRETAKIPSRSELYA